MEIQGRTLKVTLPPEAHERLLARMGAEHVRGYVLDKAGAALKYMTEKEDIEAEIHAEITLPVMWAKGAAGRLSVKASSLREQARQMLAKAAALDAQAEAKRREASDISGRIKYLSPRLNHVVCELARTEGWEIEPK
jgi:hypothetical protein